MNKQLTDLSALLDIADKQASASAFNLNTLDMRIIVPPVIQAQIDREASGIKAAIGDILQAKQLVIDLINNPATGSLVYLWLIFKDENGVETDCESPRFVWPFNELPKPGDRLEANNLIKNLYPGVADEFMNFDYYILKYSFFEFDSDGTYHQCLKLSPKV